MDALQFSGVPWAIQPDKLVEMQALLYSHRADSRIAPPSPVSGGHAMQVSGKVAVIRISGILCKRPGLIAQFFGATSTAAISESFRMAINAPDIAAVVLVIDSPGGTVDGTQAIAAEILAARGRKPIVAVADGCMCSAAYWIGASADRVYASSSVAQIGSIGVVAAHVDISGRESQVGVKTTEISAGKYKRIASNYAPLSAEGRESIQSTVDYLYSLFVGHVARARNTSEDRVLSAMADGRVFIGQQAAQAGLIDGIMSIDECITGAAKMKTELNGNAQAVACGKDDHDQMLFKSAKDYQEQHPGTDFLAALRLVSRNPAGSSTLLHSDKQREQLHRQAKAYQAAHPGTDYLAAISAVAA